MEAKLTPEHIYHLSKLAIMEYLTSGITANFDMYLTPDTMAQASVDCGFRTVICGAVMIQPICRRDGRMVSKI